MFNSESIVNTSNRVYRRRHFFNKVMLALSGATVVFGLFWLCWIILTLLTKGGSALSLTLLTQSTPPPGADGGLLNAIFGSVAMRSEEHTSELQSLMRISYAVFCSKKK